MPYKIEEGVLFNHTVYQHYITMMILYNNHQPLFISNYLTQQTPRGFTRSVKLAYIVILFLVIFLMCFCKQSKWKETTKRFHASCEERRVRDLRALSSQFHHGTLNIESINRKRKIRFVHSRNWSFLIVRTKIQLAHSSTNRFTEQEKFIRFYEYN